MKKKHIYIVLTRTNTVLSRLISIIKNDEYTHASISLDKNLYQMYSFGRRNTYNPFVGRFVKEDINKGVLGLSRNLQSMVIELDVTEEQYDTVKKILSKFIINRDLYKYNYLGLLNGIMNKEVYYHNRFLCSEFVYYVLNKSGIINFNISRNLVRPQHFLYLNAKVIYKGNLKNMHTFDFSRESLRNISV